MSQQTQSDVIWTRNRSIRNWCTGLTTPASSLKDVDIAQQIVAIYPQPLAGYKSKPTVDRENCSYMSEYQCAQLSYTIQHITIPVKTFHPPDSHHCSDVVYWSEVRD